MAEKEEQVQKKRAIATRSVLEQNRDFFDQFFTRVVKTRFKVASQMSSTAPEIQITYSGPDGSGRSAVQRSLRYQPPTGWVDPESSHAAGDLTTWLDLTIASFLEWTA